MPTRAHMTFLALASVSGACATPPSPVPGHEAHAPRAADPTAPGILVMAHGGGPDWNASVDAALAGLRDRVPVVLALGMADPHTLQAALDSLHHLGVGTVAVVRLFISGASFLHQTEYLFGLRSDPPGRAMAGHRMIDGGDLLPLQVRGDILLERTGLAGSAHVSQILRDRAAASTTDPSDTGILLIAHGMGSEEENRNLLDRMEQGARDLRSAGYADVGTATLREDWPLPKARAERAIRTAVTDMGRRWSRVVVVPYRVSGFGPYADVLEGLDYVAAGSLLPHPLVADWIEARARDRFCAAGAESPLGQCPRTTRGPGPHRPPSAHPRRSPGSTTVPAPAPRG